MTKQQILARAVCALAFFALACNNNPSEPAGTSVVLGVTPLGGATNVDPAGRITVSFSNPMMQGMEMGIVLHEGTLTGAQVPGAAVWSSDRRTLTFTPSQPLRARTTYALHLAGNMQSAGGLQLDHGQCPRLGAQPVTGSMMGGGMMGGGAMGPGMMGPGWQAADGTYGMVFTFATA